MATMLKNFTSFTKLLCIFFFFALRCGVGASALVSNTTEIKEGIVRYHYDNEARDFCSTIVIIGVGTTMAVNDYDLLAIEIVRGRPGLVAAIVDHAPRNPLKLSTRRYANLVTAIATRTSELIPVCNRKGNADNDASVRTKFFLGGHSASGMVAIKSLSLIQGFTPAGLIGLSPFQITDSMSRISVPALFWGFSTTTCGVKVGFAADQAYALSSAENGRVLYQLQNPSGHPSHCIFANHGCGPVCPCSNSMEYNWIRPAVSDSIQHFLHALESKNFTRSSLDLNLPQEIKQNHLRMFVNQDEAPTPGNLLESVPS